jgi:hypothetical protein
LIFLLLFVSVLSRTFLSCTDAETRPPPSANNRDVDRKARAGECLATLPPLLVVATKAVATLCDIVPARNMIPIVDAMDDDTTDDFIVIFRLLSMLFCGKCQISNVKSLMSNSILSGSLLFKPFPRLEIRFLIDFLDSGGRQMM